MKKVLSAVQRAGAQSPLMIRSAIKVRNQCEMLIGNFVGETSSHAVNGELWLMQSLPERAPVFMDVGANAGQWVKTFLREKPEAQGVCYEPLPNFANQLKSDLRQCKSIEVRQAALGSQPGELPLYPGSSSSEHSSLVASPSVDSKAVVVEVSTVDAELDRRKIPRVNLLKIDAEGFDFEVLLGARKALSEKRIDLIQFEYGRSWQYAGHTLAKAIRFLEGFQYQVFLLRTGGLHHVPYEQLGEYFLFSNFVAVSEQRIADYEKSILSLNLA